MAIVRRPAIAGVVAVLVALMVTGPGASASAHDQLVASTPADGERLAAAPTEVVLQFSQDVLPLGAVVIVADQAGRDWAAGDAVLDGTTVSAAVEPGMPDAGYQIRWRVVSSDGHPISGVIAFTVGDGEPYSAADSPQSGPLESATESQNDSERDAIWRIVLVGAGGAAIAVGLLALITLIRRRRADGPDDTL